MPQPKTNDKPQPKMKEWTLMFYFASDNALAPGIVTQLKAIKQAGFHQEVNVVAQFDPQPEGTPTHIFDVNLVNKLKREKADPKSPNQIGYLGSSPGDPSVSDLIEDKLWRENQTGRDGTSIRELLRASLEKKHKIEYQPEEPPPDRKRVKIASVRSAAAAARARRNGRKTVERELEPTESLPAFLKFCRESYPARRYALFILGHGVVVGNDVFLFDENSVEQSLSLIELGGILNDFKGALDDMGAAFELISFHSCSVSSLEVAYELKGTANYMLASQGPAFVGSWPYRQILMRVFKDTDGLAELYRRKAELGDEGYKAAAGEAVKQTLRTIFNYCLDNSADFLLAGYSFDLALCNLNRLGTIEGEFGELSRLLRKWLKNPLVKNFVLLAHWESQSHWQESYTDLRDFCFCLERQCREFLQGLNGDAKTVLGKTYQALTDIGGACIEVAKCLEEEDGQGDEKIVVESKTAGPAQQYSCGLSVYFPWSRPVSDRPIMEDYECYSFAETEWFKFLRSYFKETRRRPRQEEEDGRVAAGVTAARAPRVPSDQEKADEELNDDIAARIYTSEGVLSSENALAAPGKTNPRDPTGDTCSCQSIKNYPRDTRPRSVRMRKPPDTAAAAPARSTAKGSGKAKAADKAQDGARVPRDAQFPMGRPFLFLNPKK